MVFYSTIADIRWWKKDNKLSKERNDGESKPIIINLWKVYIVMHLKVDSTFE